MSIDRSLVGLTSVPRTFEVAERAIAAFAGALGDPCPEFQRGQIAPPTFPDTFGLTLPVLFPTLGVDVSHALHGEQEYVYERPLCAGDRVTCVARIVDVAEKRTSLGRMSAVAVEMDAHDAAGELVFTSRATFLLR